MLYCTGILICCRPCRTGRRVKIASCDDVCSARLGRKAWEAGELKDLCTHYRIRRWIGLSKVSFRRDRFLNQLTGNAGYHSLHDSLQISVFAILMADEADIHHIVGSRKSRTVSYISMSSKRAENGIINRTALKISSPSDILSSSKLFCRSCALAASRMPDFLMIRHCSSSEISMKGFWGTGRTDSEGGSAGILRVM